jgi:prepilin peptidase CpaA
MLFIRTLQTCWQTPDSLLCSVLKYGLWLVGVVLVLGGLSLSLRYGVLAAILFVAVVTDVKARKIPNRLVYTGLVLGPLCQALLPSGDGVWVSLLGMGLGLAVFLPLYLLRAMGAGDVKLMAMVGGFIGPRPLIGATLATFVSGGIMAVSAALMKHEFRRLVENLKLMLFGSAIKAASRQLPIPDQPVASVGKLPYAIAIAVGTLGYLLWNHYATH